VFVCVGPKTHRAGRAPRSSATSFNLDQIKMIQMNKMTQMNKIVR